MVRSIFEANKFSHTESHEWNILWSCGSGKSYLFEGLNEFQKINHFPQSFEITRKDRLSINVSKMKERHGDQSFDFLPETYVLPDQFGEFVQAFKKYKKDAVINQQILNLKEAERNLWIVKPTNLSRGRGIYIVDDISEVNIEDEAAIISRYISNPLLINGHKFDLRIYVVVTSYEPLRIYVY